MRVLVTGVSGYLGQALVRQWLVNRERHLIGVSRMCASLPAVNGLTCISLDLGQPDAAASLPIGLSADVVIHLAALVHNVSGITEGELLQRNVAMALNAWKIAEKVGAKKLIYSSSMTVYGSGDGYVRAQEADALVPESEYARSKLECETTLKQESRNSRAIQLVILRFPGLFGAGRPRGLIRVLAEGIQKRQAVSLNLKGLGNWDFMHVEDAAGILRKVIEREDVPDTIFNAGYDDPRGNLDYLIGFFRARFASNSEVLVNSKESYRPFRLNTEKLRHWLGPGVAGNLDSALERFIEEMGVPCRL